MEEVLAAVKAIGSQLEATAKYLGERLDGVETRLGGVERRLDGVEKRLDGVEAQQLAMENRLGVVERQLHAIEKRVEEACVMIGGLFEAPQRQRGGGKCFRVARTPAFALHTLDSEGAAGIVTAQSSSRDDHDDSDNR
jgi:hypothetical protein